MKFSDFWVVGWEFTKFLMSYLKPQVSFSFKLCIALQCYGIYVFCTFLAETLFDFYKRSLPQCRISDFWLLRWNFTKVVLWLAIFLKVYKVSAKKVWRSYVSWYQRVIVCTFPPPPLLSAGKLSLQPNFQKGVFDRTSTFRGGFLGKSGMTFSRGGGGGGLQFLHKK